MGGTQEEGLCQGVGRGFLCGAAPGLGQVGEPGEWLNIPGRSFISATQCGWAGGEKEKFALTSRNVGGGREGVTFAVNPPCGSL